MSVTSLFLAFPTTSGREMILTSIKAENYKSYLKVQSVAIEPGFNLFIGGNNSGKTSMLEALDFDPHKNAPHLSHINSPKYGMAASGCTELSVEVKTTIKDICNQANGQLFLPVAIDFQKYLNTNTDIYSAAADLVNKNPEVILTIGYGGGYSSMIAKSCLGTSSKASTKGSDNLYVYTANIANPSGAASGGSVTNHGGAYPNQLHEISLRFKTLFYRFSANRRISNQCAPTAHPVTLEADAANLPYCLNNFQSTDPFGYNTLCKLINRVFPSVAWVQAVPKPGNIFEGFCLPLAPELQRNDLAVPLSLMGTGVGNVISILYVMLTSRFPQVIAIDEPNSFLHPKALRELLQILAIEGRQHQYILTAHSADVIAALGASHITIFNFDGAQTTTRQIASTEVAQMRTELSELGIRMTDLHGRDKVLWVEGQTEELVMPELLRFFCPEMAAGTAILRVENTGKFDKKGTDIKEIANSYERLTASALVPPMVAILLDSEKRKKADCARLERDTMGRLRFLPATMLENYLLDAEAISAVLLSHNESVSLSEVDALIAANGGVAAGADGASILHKIFLEVSNARVEFSKTRDVPRLVTWLLANKPTYLAALGDFLRDVLSGRAVEQ
jgi:predicted ATPase